LILIGINGFFVAGEFAMVAVNRSKVEARASEGDKRAVRLLRKLRDLSFELSGAQLGITVTSLIIGAMAKDTVARFLEPVLGGLGISSLGLTLTIALILTTVFQMVMGELVPKNYAIARPYGTSLFVGLPMARVNAFFRPVINFFNRSANWTVRRFGIEPRDELAGLRSMQELQMIVQASSAEGELDSEESSILTRAIGFVQRDARDAMVSRVSVIGIEATASVEDLRALSMETGHSRFPVLSGSLDELVGIAYVKDSFGVARENRSTTPVSEIASPVHSVPDSMPLDTLLIELQNKGKTIAIVEDEYGGTAGIVTVEDIVEEILGEIEDEHDEPEVSEDLAEPGVFSGSLHRREVAEATGFTWPEGDYDTLNGYMTAELERFPIVGDVVEEEEFRLEVVSVDEHLASEVSIKRVEQ